MFLRRLLSLLFICVGASAVLAQDLSNIQIHGFATQGILYSNHNNYLTADTNKGSMQWTDGAVSLSDVVSDNLRVGIQVHMRQLGQLGGATPEIDWAVGDYKLSEHIGFRAGKVKTPLGLFNDSQDIDAAFLWALLPESNYPSDNRDYTLAHLGADVYGSYGLGKRAGKLVYRGYVGYRFMDLQSGNVKLLVDRFGFNFSSPPGGKAYGGDVRWQTPIRGLMVGASETIQALDGKASNGTIHYSPQSTNVQYFQYERGKFYIAGEYKRRPIYATTAVTTTTPVLKNGAVVNTTTTATSIASLDRRAGFFMAAYRVLPKLQVGGYFDREIRAHTNLALPADYLNEWVASGRFDINSFFYFKVEEHFIRGTEASLYTSNNPAGYTTSAKLTAAKLGFSF
jgi:hypothetical protein